MATDLQHPAPPPPAAAQQKQIPRFLSFSIYALVGLTLLTIAALFIDSIEDRGSRIFLTFIVFAVFVGLTAMDTLRSTEKAWYPPAALLSNGIFLGVSLLTIWLAPSFGFGGSFVIGITLLIIAFALILRLGLLLGVLAMGAVDREVAGERSVEGTERKSSLAAAWLSSSAAVLFVAYIGINRILSERIDSYRIDGFWDIYLKVSTAVLILAGLSLSVSLLLRWFFGADRRKQIEAIQQADRAAQQPQDLLPWPRFPDGSAYPANTSGQPDFEAAKSWSSAPAAPAEGYPVQ